MPWGESRSTYSAIQSHVDSEITDNSNFWRDIAIRANMQNTSIAAQYKLEIVQSMRSKLRRILNYIDGKAPQITGVPRLFSSRTATSTLSFKEYIDDLEGTSVNIEYLVQDALDYYHLVSQHLAESYNYDVGSNTLVYNSEVWHVEGMVHLGDQSVYLAHLDQRASRRSPHHLYEPSFHLRAWVSGHARQYAGNSNYVVTDYYILQHVPSSVAMNLRIDLARTDAIGNIVRTSFSVQNGIFTGYEFWHAAHQTNPDLYPADYDPDREYLWARYSYTQPNSLAVTKYFTYGFGQGNPQLDTLQRVSDVIDVTLFPLIIYRYDFLDLSENDGAVSGDYFTTASYITRTLGFNYLEFAKSVHENPEIDEMAQVFTMFGASLDSELPQIRRYVYEFFLFMYVNNGSENAWFVDTDGVIKETPRSWSENLDMTFAGIRQRIYVRGIGLNTETGFAYDADNNIIPVGEVALIRLEDHTVINRYYSGSSFYERAVTELVYIIRYRIDINQYQEMILVHPYVAYRISSPQGSPGIYTIVDSSTQGFIVPVIKEIVDYTFTDFFTQEYFYKNALYLVSNAYVITSLGFFESPFFGGIMTFASIAIAIVSFGSGSGVAASIFNTAVTLTGSTAVAVIITIGVLALSNDIFSRLLLKLAEELDVEIIVAIAAIALAAYTGDVQLTFLSTEQMTMAAIGLVETKGEQLAQEAQDFYDLIKEEQPEYEKQIKELEQAIEELMPDQSLLEAIGFTSRFVSGERADAYYNRTTTSSEIPEHLLNAAENTLENTFTYRFQHVTE